MTLRSPSRQVERPAGAFVQAVVRELAAREMTRAELARSIGVKPYLVNQWLNRDVSPTFAYVDAIGAVLGDHVVKASLADRRARCALQACGRVFYRRDRRQMYCRPRCSAKAAERFRTKRVGFTRTQERDGLRNAIAAFCFSCEPAGVCRDSRCPLRPGCPFPVDFSAIRQRPASQAVA